MEAASIVLSPALQVIFDRLASTALEEIADTLGLDDKLNSLQDYIKRVEAILQAAEDQQITNKYVRFWLSNLKKAVSDTEDLLDLSFARYTSSYRNLILKGSHAEKIKEAIQRLEKTINEGFSTFNFGEPSIGDRRSIQRETGSCIFDPKIYGRDDEKEKLVKLLLSSETSQDGYATCIPIIGIGGIGKTTLAQLAYNDERVSKHFDSRMWIFVSENFNVKKIMKEAIERVTDVKCKLSEIEPLQSRLLKLLQKKRCLIVLDNIWTEDQDDWDELRPLFRAGLDGCKIIVTTRSQKIPLIMDFPNSPFYLNILKDDDCWSLFKQGAFRCGEEEKYPNLTQIGKEIIKKFGGMPLAAKCLGRSMRSKREEKQWLFMRDCELWELDESQHKVVPALMLSLPPHLRQCFAFFSLFPKNYAFKKQKLIHLWTAEGFIPKEGSKRPEDIGEEYFSELLWILFLQEVRPHDGGEIIGYKMNDIIHDLAQYVAGKEYVVLEQDWPQNRSPAEIRHASIVYRYGARIKIPETLYKAKHLRTLLLIGDSGSLQNGDKIYSSFEYLRVLDLNNCDLVDLPNSLGDLICLRYLDLSYTLISKLPENIQYLFFLQTLNLSCCHNLESLPCLGGQNLRHLNLSGCVRLTGMPPDMKRLRHLQTLPLFVVPKNGVITQLPGLNLYGELNIAGLVNIGFEDNDIVEDFSSLWPRLPTFHKPSLAGLPMKENLESLGLYWGSIPQFRYSFPKLPNAQLEVCVSGSHIARASENVIGGLQPHKNLEKLVINGYPGIKFPNWALPNLVAADFTNCRNCKHLPAHGNLPLLKTLSLQGMHGVKSIGTEFYGDSTDICFPSLEELSISDFANLKEWSSANVGNAFPRLKKLTVKSCPKLAHVLLPQSLQHLELRNCNPTMVLVADLGLLSVLILDKIPDIVYLPEGLFASASLSVLKILSCPKLHSMPLEMQNLSSLKSLTIRWCEELSSLPQSLQKLEALESLEISGCGSLTSLPVAGLASLRTLSIENCSELTSLLSSLEQLTLLEDLTIMDCPNLASFPAGVQHLSSLRSLMVQNCPWFDSLPEGLQNVKTLHCLEISNCDNLTALPEWFEDLDCLRSLIIYDYPNIKQLPPGFNLLTKLQTLSIQECPELEERCRQGSGEDWSKIAHVPHKYIGSPQVRLSGEASTSGSSSVQGSAQ